LTWVIYSFPFSTPPNVATTSSRVAQICVPADTSEYSICRAVFGPWGDLAIELPAGGKSSNERWLRLSDVQVSKSTARDWPNRRGRSRLKKILDSDAIVGLRHHDSHRDLETMNSVQPVNEIEILKELKAIIRRLERLESNRALVDSQWYDIRDAASMTGLRACGENIY